MYTHNDGKCFTWVWSETTTIIHVDGKCFTWVWSDTTTFIHIDGKYFRWLWNDTTAVIHIDGKCFEDSMTTTQSVDGVWNGIVALAPPPGPTILYVICKLYNATYFINIKGFKDFYLETKLLLLRSFTKNNKSWIFFTPTIQALLEHSAELIKINNCQGLGAFSESGLDGVYDNSDQSLQHLRLVR